MTTDEIIEAYAKLLILQYIGKPKAFATVKAWIGPFVMNQLPVAVQDAFTLDTAEGAQLDILGKYVGVIRTGLTFSGPVILTDSDFRMLIKIKIFQNNSGSSLADIQNLIAIFFPDALRVFDHANMRLDYYFDSAFGTMDLAEIFVRQGFLPKPMGVGLGALIYAPNINNFFGFRTYELAGVNISGFNSYTDYQTDEPWLSYADAIVP